MYKVCSSLGQKWGNERAITGINIILTCPLPQTILKKKSIENTPAICSGHAPASQPPPIQLFSKSVLDIKTRLVVTVGLGTKWMPNSDSPSNFITEYKFLGY